MKCLFVLMLTIFVQNVISEPQLLLRIARISFTTDRNVHKNEEVKDVEYFDHTLVNGSQLRVTTDGMSLLFEGSFQNMENLQILQIPKCKIEEISPRAFLNVPNLDRIQLQDNLLTRIENGVFNFMNISQLYLHRNKISFIHSEAFDNMPNLHTIKLNANQIRSWDTNWFFNTPKLTDIFIRRNFISTVEQNAFKNMKKLQVGHEENQNSTNIYLSKNQINFIHPQALSDLVRLNHFYLDRNNLTDIPQNLFAHIESINFLNLRRNKIEKLSPFMFPRTNKIRTLDLTRNELECIPPKIATQADKILLEDNYISCDCMDILKKALEDKKLKNTIVAGDCSPNSDDMDEGDDEMNDEEVEDDENEE